MQADKISVLWLDPGGLISLQCVNAPETSHASNNRDLKWFYTIHPFDTDDYFNWLACLADLGNKVNLPLHFYPSLVVAAVEGGWCFTCPLPAWRMMIISSQTKLSLFMRGVYHFWWQYYEQLLLRSAPVRSGPVRSGPLWSEETMSRGFSTLSEPPTPAEPRGAGDTGGALRWPCREDEEAHWDISRNYVIFTGWFSKGAATPGCHYKTRASVLNPQSLWRRRKTIISLMMKQQTSGSWGVAHESPERSLTW